MIEDLFRYYIYNMEKILEALWSLWEVVLKLVGRFIRGSLASMGRWQLDIGHGSS